MALDNRTKFRIATNIAHEHNMRIKEVDEIRDWKGIRVYKVFRVVEGKAYFIGKRYSVAGLLRFIQKAAEVK